jgi:hypothetical protein
MHLVFFITNVANVLVINDTFSISCTRPIISPSSFQNSHHQNFSPQWHNLHVSTWMFSLDELPVHPSCWTSQVCICGWVLFLFSPTCPLKKTFVHLPRPPKLSIYCVSMHLPTYLPTYTLSIYLYLPSLPPPHPFVTKLLFVDKTSIFF